MLFRSAAMVDALPVDQYGFNRRYLGLSKPPTVTRASLLPRDDAEIVQDNATAVAAGIRSRRTAIVEQWPAWTPQDVDDELEQIAADEHIELPALPDLDSSPV